MKFQYVILGNIQLGDEVLLKLGKHNAVEDKSDFMTNITSNPFGFIENMKLDAIKEREVEQLRIPKEFWDENKWNIGDIINIEVNEL